MGADRVEAKPPGARTGEFHNFRALGKSPAQTAPEGGYVKEQTEVQ